MSSPSGVKITKDITNFKSKAPFSPTKRVTTTDRVELYELSKQGKGTDFMFLIGNYWDTTDSCVYVDSEIVSQGSKRLAKIVKTERKLKGENAWYAILPHSNLYLDQFKRMIEFIYTGDVTTFRKSNPSRKEISDLLQIGEQFKSVKLIEFCFEKMIAIKEGKIRKVESSLAKLSLQEDHLDEDELTSAEKMWPSSHSDATKKSDLVKKKLFDQVKKDLAEIQEEKVEVPNLPLVEGKENAEEVQKCDQSDSK